MPNEKGMITSKRECGMEPWPVHTPGLHEGRPRGSVCSLGHKHCFLCASRWCDLPRTAPVGGTVNSIWKYPLAVTDSQAVEMPQGSSILCLQMQDGVPCVWARVNPKAKKILRTFATYGTGHSLSDTASLRYVGTYQLPNGLVFHVFVDGPDLPTT